MRIGPKISKALMKAQGNFPSIEKKTTAYNYKYATLDQILDLVRGPLSDEGILIVQPSTVDHEGISVQKTQLYHCESGESVTSELRLMDQGGPQDRGSEITYMRRYSLLNVCGIFPVDEDTDGKEAQDRSKATPKRKAPAKPTVRASAGAANGNGGGEQTDERGVHVVVAEFAKDCKTVEDLTVFWKQNRDELDKLNDGHPELYAKAIMAFTNRKAEILSAK